MANDYTALKKLLADPQLIATVQQVNGDGTITAQTPQGNSVRLRGAAQVNKMVIYQGNQILNEIPALPLVPITIDT